MLLTVKEMKERYKMKNWFEDVKTVDEAKKVYRKLAMEHHPDQGGNEETFKEIYSQFERVLEIFMHSAFNSFEEKRGFEAKGNVNVFADILKKVMEFNVTIEIIGYWIYAFDSYEVKDQLKEMGFWFSKKHRAWVYSGAPKVKRATRMTLSDIRVNRGSQIVKEKEKRQQIASAV